ncbi:AAA family ATPase [Paenibacillus nasutitermitis]|nr:AAA family ATPase [Paenibacillus nasutitermitis]
MRKLVFFIGGAGAGKTTVAKALAARRHAALFDMDTLSRPASEAIMRLAGLDPNDRDSPVYKAYCRDLGYRLTMDAALENVEIGSDAYVIGPFTKETEDPHWLERELAAIGASLADVEVKVIFVTLEGEGLYRQRIQERGSVLDGWKLENWGSFRKSLVPRDTRWNLPSSSVLHYDNSASWNEGRITQLEHFIYGEGS